MERKDPSNGNIPAMVANNTKLSASTTTTPIPTNKPRTASTKSRTASTHASGASAQSRIASAHPSGARTSRNLVSASKAMPVWVDLQGEKFNLKHAFEDDSNIEIPLSRKVAAWKRPVDIFVPHNKESTKEMKEIKEGKETKDGKDHPPFCVVAPLIPALPIARSPSPSSLHTSQQRTMQESRSEGSHSKLSDGSHSKLEVHSVDPPQVEQYQRENYLNPECFSRLVNGAVLPPLQISSPTPSPSVLHLITLSSSSPIPPPIGEEEPPRGHSSKGSRDKREREKDKDREEEIEEREDEIEKEDDPEAIQQQLFQMQVNHIKQQLQHPVDTRWMTSLFTVMLQNEAKVGEGNLLWELIYPKGKDGRPTYNPSGKYCVRLFVMGAWRKITIDDRIPLDENNSIMFMQSNNVLELWPLLITKALFKVATLMQVFTACEADYLYWLGGWVPQIEPVVEDTTLTMLNNLQECNQVILCASVAPISLDTIPDCVDSIKAASQAGLRSGQLYLVSGITTDETTLNKTIHLKTIQPPRIAVTRPTSSRLVSRPSSAAQVHSDEHPLLGADIFVPYNDFCTYFKSLVVYHSPSYPYNEVIQALGDVPPSFPPLLYTENDVPTHLAIHITFTSPYKSEVEEDGVTLTLERYHWTAIGSNPDAPLITLKAATGICTLVWIPAGRNVYKILLSGKGVGGYQIRFSSPTVLQIGDYSKILPKLALEVSEYEPVYKTCDSGIWSLWFKYVVQVQEEGVWSWQLVLPEGSPSNAPSSSTNTSTSTPLLHSSASSMAINAMNNNTAEANKSVNSLNAYPYVRLRVIDNDTLEEFPSVLGCTPPRRFAPNELGYTVMGELKSPFRVPSSKCKLRVISSHPLFTVECETTRCVHEFEDSYVPTQTVPLFRDVLRVKEKAQVAIHVGVPSANGGVYLKLQIFDKGEEIYSVEGKRCCIIPVFYLYPTQKKDEEFHKYILQASIVRYIPSADETPRTRVKTRVKGKKKDRKGEKSQAWAEDDFVWQLRILSSMAVDVKKDTEREDRHTSIKASWEAANPGRAAKGRISRDKFLHSLSLVPSFLDPEGKESGPKYVKTTTLPPAMVRIKRDGTEDEIIDVDQLIARSHPPLQIEPAPITSSTSQSKSMLRTRSHPNSSSSPLARITSKNILPSASVPSLPRSPSSSFSTSPENNNTTNNNLNSENTSSNTLSPPSPSFLPPLNSSSQNIPVPIANTTPYSSFNQNESLKPLNPNAKLRTTEEAVQENSKITKENEEFVDWHKSTVERCKANLQDAEQSKTTILAYLEGTRMEAKKKQLTYAELREQYNAKCFPHAIQTTPEKDPQSSQPKEKTKRKKVSK